MPAMILGMAKKKPAQNPYRYSKAELARLLNMSQQQIQDLWNNWGTQNDRLQHATDSMGQHSTLDHVRAYQQRMQQPLTPLPQQPPPQPPAKP